MPTKPFRLPRPIDFCIAYALAFFLSWYLMIYALVYEKNNGGEER